MIGLDTNILLRWLVDESLWPDDNPVQTKAVARLLASGETFYINAIVLAETLWVLLNPMRQPRRTVLDLLDRLLSSADLVLQNDAAVRLARDLFAESKAGLHDCLIGAFNRADGCERTVTFDRAASRLPGFRLLTAKD